MIPEYYLQQERQPLPIGRWLAIAAILVMGGLLGRGLANYATHIGVFDLERIEVRGNRILNKTEIVKALDLPLTGSLFDLDLEALQVRIESLAYVYGVRIGRTFPHTLFVEIVENRPLAYVAASEYFVLTAEGATLALPHGRMELELATVAGVERPLEALNSGTVEGHLQLDEVRSTLNHMSAFYPRLFAELSEMVVELNGDVTLYLSETSTAVRLGSQDIRYSIALLDAFLNTVRGKRTLRDYAYIDLRYKHQVVVKERV